MATRIVLKNRTVWANRAWNDHLSVPAARKALPQGHDGEPVNVAEGIAPTDASSPFRAGVVAYDAEEDLHYRCVPRLDPRDGWAISEFWQRRWKLQHRDILELARRGLIDAAFVAGSQARKYRCRDEYQLGQNSVFRRLRLSRARPVSRAPR